MKNCLRNISAARFNQLYTIGARFNYYPVVGIPDSIEVVTETEAWELCGRTVVKVAGRIGGVSVQNLEPVTADRKVLTLHLSLPKMSVGEVMHVTGFDRQYAEGWVSANDWAIEQIKQAAKVAGVAVEFGGAA